MEMLLFSLVTGVLLKTSTACVATSNTGAVTTVAPGTVTTTTTAASATTTTTVANACQTCMANQINFIMADPNQPGTIDSTFQVLPNDPNTGCSRLMAICAAQAGMFAFMQFNINQGGPAENAGMPQTVMAPLDCVNGQWVYAMQRVVTAVDCSEAPIGGK